MFPKYIFSKKGGWRGHKSMCFCYNRLFKANHRQVVDPSFHDKIMGIINHNLSTAWKKMKAPPCLPVNHRWARKRRTKCARNKIPVSRMNWIIHTLKIGNIRPRNSISVIVYLALSPITTTTSRTVLGNIGSRNLLNIGA